MRARREVAAEEDAMEQCAAMLADDGEEREGGRRRGAPPRGGPPQRGQGSIGREVHARVRVETVGPGSVHGPRGDPGAAAGFGPGRRRRGDAR